MSSRSWCSCEYRAGAPYACVQPVDLLERVVERERGTRRGRHLEMLHHRHCAVMSRADGDAVFIENGAKVVRMHARDHEGDQAGLIACRADDSQAFDLPERLGSGGEESMLRGVGAGPGHRT